MYSFIADNVNRKNQNKRLVALGILAIGVGALLSKDILRIEFGEVLIPEVVYQEVTANGLNESREVKDADWITVASIGNAE